MKNKFTLISILTAFAAASCVQTPVSNEKKGYNIAGNPASCEPMAGDKICTEIFTEEDRFALECRKQGHEAIQCDCHQFLCSEKIDFK